MSSQPHIFYTGGAPVDGDSVVLPRAESHHAAKVLRLRKGEIVILADGLGCAYRGEITRLGRGAPVQVRIHSVIRNFGEPQVRLTLATGLSTGSKFDTVVEKGTELGVSRFVPLITDRSTVKVDDPRRAMAKLSRYEKVALAAMKQSRRSLRPEITSPVTFENYMKEIDGESVNLLFHPGASAAFRDAALAPGAKRVNLIVGAESGFSDDEIASARDRGVTIVSLGRRILRTETAGPVICALVMNSLGELR
ncbi:MAG: 16S rRNA (uracil(1498)-N(3))-methyltransferase [Candidatus Zixiibacteriota bacterium]|nr:MAG: 16S rRNA (uracil(1498)-N(3))-methyltransferase [candidate division Zixibacteria bacterium]